MITNYVEGFSNIDPYKIAETVKPGDTVTVLLNKYRPDTEEWVVLDYFYFKNRIVAGFHFPNYQAKSASMCRVKDTE